MQMGVADSKPAEKAFAAQPANQRFPSLAEAIVKGEPLPDLPTPMCFSGACWGADETFGECALAVGHGLIHFMGPEDEASEKVKQDQESSLFWISGDLLSGDIVEGAWQLAGKKRIKGGQRTDAWESKVLASRRNYCQVRQAEAVYVVAWRMQKGKDPFTGREDVAENETPVMDIGGGTGWACQWYIDRFAEGGEDPSKCKLFLFHDSGPPWAQKEAPTYLKWSQWDCGGEKWVPMVGAPPPPGGLYAGIGGTILSEAARAAICALYNSSSKA